MDAERFDRFTRTWGSEATRRRMLSGVLGAVLTGLGAKRLAAQSDTATAGSGGYATASANGGTVVMGDINSGGNVGNVISVGDTYGSVWVDGGNVSNSTTIGISANGGTAIADASGGSGNIAGTDGGGDWVACNCNACPPGQYCCNWSCGICRAYGDSCRQRECNRCSA